MKILKGVIAGLCVAIIAGILVLYIGNSNWLMFSVVLLPGLIGGFISSFIGRSKPILSGLLVGFLCYIGLLLFVNLSYDSNCDTLGCSFGIGIFVIGGLMNIVTGLCGGFLGWILYRNK